MVMVRNLNARIDELSRQCWRGTYFDFERFAELIVQDCVAQVALIGVSNFENEDIMWTVETAIDIIKSRFGIEE